MAIASAIIGGAIAAGGAIASSKANSKAIKTATNAQTESNEASLALQRDIYGQNKLALSPFIQTGVAANTGINALLGLSVPQTQQPTQQNPLSGFGGYSFEGFDGPLAGRTPGINPNAPQQPGIDPRQAQENAFQTWRDSTGYKFGLNEGMDAVGSAYGGAGTFQSGAAGKAMQRYGQDYASQNFGNYFNALQGQQNLGFSAASAQAGVGQNYAGSVSNLNSQNANAIAQLASAKANNQTGLFNALGTIGGTILGRGL